MSAFPLPVVVLEGTPAERGRQHGARFRREIATALARLGKLPPSALARARQRAEAAWPPVDQHAADLALELRGIAEGAGQEPIAILLHVGFEFFEETQAGGCTALACAGPQGAIVGQNWDGPAAAARDLVLFVHRGSDAIELAAVASAGGLAWAGCNRHGLALVNNDLMLRGKAKGLPSQIVRRLLLAQRDVAGALAILATLPSMAGRSYVLGDAAGQLAGIEVAAGGFSVNQRATPVLHTNHALAPEIAVDEDESLQQRTYPSSRHRLDVARRHARDLHSVPQIMELLSNREGSPNSICKTLSAAEPTETLFSLVVDCGSRTLQLCAGQPARDRYRALRPWSRPFTAATPRC